MMNVAQKIQRLFDRRDRRKEALAWWEGLTRKEKIIIETKFYDSPTVGKSEAIDIEAMHSIYGL